MFKYLFLNNKILIKNINSNLLNNITILFSRFFQISLFLLFIDKELYSLWILVISISSFLTFFDLGLINFIGNLLLKSRVRNNFSIYSKYLKIGRSFINYCSSFIVLLICFFYFFINPSYLGVEEYNSKIFKYVLIFFSIGIIIQFYTGYYFQILRSFDKMYIATYIFAITNLIQFLILFITLYISNDLITSSIFYNLCFFINFFLLKKFSNNYKKYFNNYSTTYKIKKFFLKKILKGSISFLFISLNHLMLNFLPIIMLKKYYSNELLVEFFVYKSFVLYALQFMNIFYYSYQPEINKLYYSKNFESFKLSQILNRLILILCILIFLLYIFSYLFSDLFFYYWTNNQVVLDFNYLNIFLLFIVIRLLWNYILNIFQSINYLYITSILYTFFSIIYFIIIVNFANKLDFLLFSKILLFSEIILLLFFNIILIYIKKIEKLILTIKQLLIIFITFALYYINI